MTILHRGFSYAADDLSKMGTGADPLAAVRGYLTKAINKLRTRVLISQLEGLFDTALAANVYDNSSSTTAGLSDANYLSAASVIAGKNKLGERGDELTIIAMHSAVYNYLLQVGALTFSTSALSTGGAITWGGGGVGLTSMEVAYFCGLRVVVDDMLAPDDSGEEDVYPCLHDGQWSCRRRCATRVANCCRQKHIIAPGCVGRRLSLRFSCKWY